MVEAIYRVTKTGSRFTIAGDSSVCTKKYSNGKTRSLPGYALIPPDKLQDAANQYEAFRKEGKTDEASLNGLLKILREKGYNGERGIMLYLYEKNGKFEIRGENVTRLKNPRQANEKINLEELGIENPYETESKKDK